MAAARTSLSLDGLTLTLKDPTPEDAAELAARTDIVWHQRFQLAPGIFAPGTNDVGFLAFHARLPDVLHGESVLDIGTTNGGVAFELERRGAGRVIAVDILDADHFGFNAIKRLVGSQAEHVQASIYELPSLLDEKFDIVLFMGVLYHLRHPLLALDNVRRLTRGTAYIESAICDTELPGLATTSIARFYRGDSLGNDPSNWFAPNLVTLSDWCESCGMEIQSCSAWPDPVPSRAMVAARPSAGPPEYQRISYERPLNATLA